MVDPNRKINRLSELLSFVEECEQEFLQRYTTNDKEFMAQCSQPQPKPPVIMNWISSGGVEGSNGYQRRGSGDRNWQRRGGSAGYNNNNRDRGYRGNRYEPYQRRDRDRGGRYRFSDRPHSHRQHSEPQHGGSTMQVRRDYGNFVRASKE